MYNVNALLIILLQKYSEHKKGGDNQWSGMNVKRYKCIANDPTAEMKKSSKNKKLFNDKLLKKMINKCNIKKEDYTNGMKPQNLISTGWVERNSLLIIIYKFYLYHHICMKQNILIPKVVGCVVLLQSDDKCRPEWQNARHYVVKELHY